jgi:RNA polymerase sigma-70 factor, ECF subfamily
VTDCVATTDEPDITDLLSRMQAGDEAAREQLVQTVYDELRRLARAHMRKERAGHTLQATALVNEAYIRLAKIKDITWRGRGHFFELAAVVMRRILVEHARARLAGKRGGGIEKVVFDERLLYRAAKPVSILDLDEALGRLAKRDPRMSKIVELRFFAGLTSSETAQVLEVPEKTVRSDWQLARAWFKAELNK